MVTNVNFYIMKKEERISEINRVLQEYFEKHLDSGKIAAKEFMNLFIENGIFKRNNKDGLPIRQLLRELDKENQLNKIPYVYAERKEKNVNWYFCSKI